MDKTLNKPVRANGYYWVTYESKRIISEWSDGYWFFMGTDEDVKGGRSVVTNINEKQIVENETE